jgi:hypothetical protein
MRINHQSGDASNSPWPPQGSDISPRYTTACSVCRAPTPWLGGCWKCASGFAPSIAGIWGYDPRSNHKGSTFVRSGIDQRIFESAGKIDVQYRFNAQGRGLSDYCLQLRVSEEPTSLGKPN